MSGPGYANQALTVPDPRRDIRVPLSQSVFNSLRKSSDGMTRLIPSLVVVVVGYALAFYLLALCLKSMPVGFVYSIWAGLGVVGVALVGYLMFDESMTVTKTAGIGLIIGGVVLVHAGTG